LVADAQREHANVSGIGPYYD
jgi:hypothetical protein